MGLISYYCLIIVVFIGLIIYDLLFYSTFKNDVCPEIPLTTAPEENTDEAATNGGRILKLIDIDDYNNNIAN